MIDSVSFSGYKQDEVIAFAALSSREKGMDLIDLAVIEYSKSIKTDMAGYKQLGLYAV